jgi:opacity protein-like surface antigen
MLKRFVLPLVLLFVATGHPAMAQEKGQVGLTMGYPISIGLIWHASDTVALRPSFNFSHQSSELTTSALAVTGSTNDATSWSANIGALFYLHTWEKASAYVAPIFGYTRVSSTSSGQTSSGTTSTSSSHGNAYSFTGSVGAHYALSRRFSVFGEVGVGYSHATTTYPQNETKTNVWSPRSAVGVILYFN